ncbi:unnamed protein product [Eruca vesicaria subsp. sativa]|uniref:Serine/threonine-protein kinase BSK n=1 Tax=Eruca vesicaria subsp. sativa TaxID=29727 RepID=A0ABC8KTC9_ERUVS|nr:unnamed protein product [Eruca vesicaria subsp. sativa]
MRLKAAYSTAEALDYCSSAGFASYNSLSAYSILFDENGDACLSCFGLMKEINNDQRTTGNRFSIISSYYYYYYSYVNPESVMFRFGTILMDLLSGKPIPPSHAHDMIHGKDTVELIDPNLKGNFSAEEATIVFKLASRCLQYEDIESINTKDIVTTLETLQTKTDAPSYAMLEMVNQRDLSWNKLSPLGKACLRMDLTAIHKILVIAGYADDKEVIEVTKHIN